MNGTDDELDQDELLRRGLHPAQLAGLIPKLDDALPPAAAGGTTSPPAPAAAPASNSAAAQPAPSRLPKMRAQTDTDQAEVNRLTQTGSGIDQFSKKHHIAGPLMRIADIAGSAMFPGVAVNVPGSTLHHQALLGQATRQAAGAQRAIGEEAQAEESQARAAGAESEDELRRAQAAKARAETVTAGEAKPHKADIHEMYAEAVTDALGRGVNPSDDPKVMQLSDAITGLQRQPAPKEAARDDRAIAIYAKPENQRTAEENSYLKGYEAYVNKTKVQPGVLRMEVLGNMRQTPVIDTATGQPTFANANTINANPGQYAPAGIGAKAMGQQALIEDIRGNIQSVRASLNNPKMPEFSASQRATMAFALGSRDPVGALDAALRGGTLGSLTPEQQDYLISNAQLVENAMAMRSVLGAGQGSEQLRDAIRATIPGPQTPDKRYALKQLAAFEAVLDRLKKGVPNVPLNGGGAEQNGQPQRPANVPAGYVFKDGPRGRGWYKPSGQ